MREDRVGRSRKNRTKRREEAIEGDESLAFASVRFAGTSCGPESDGMKSDGCDGLGWVGMRSDAFLQGREPGSERALSRLARTCRVIRAGGSTCRAEARKTENGRDRSGSACSRRIRKDHREARQD